MRSYGFKTFGHLWDEQYDLESDPDYRLVKITNLMRQIANWTPEVKETKLAEAQAVTEYNRKHFFSLEFFNKLRQELKDNLTAAFDKLDNENTSQEWLTSRSRMQVIESIANLDSPLSKLDDEAWNAVTELAKKYCLQNNSLK